VEECPGPAVEGAGRSLNEPWILAQLAKQRLKRSKCFAAGVLHDVFEEVAMNDACEDWRIQSWPSIA